MANLNDCYQCGGWMTADDTQARDFHGLCNACVLKASRALDAAYARNGDDTMQVRNRDYPSENDEDMEPSLMWQDLDGEWYPINATSPEWVLNSLKLRDPNVCADIMRPVGNIPTYQNAQDMLDYLGATDEAELNHMTYKATDCGGWLHFIPGGVQIGTIVEGSDAEFSETLQFPLTHDEYNAAWERIEALADEAWHDANDVESINPETESN